MQRVSDSQSRSFVLSVLFRRDAPHDGLQSLDAFRNRTEANVCSYFEVLPGSAIKCRPAGSPIKIRVASLGECCPKAAQKLFEMFIFVRALPVSRERIAQEEKLFTMVRSEPRTFPRIDIGEVVQV
jgi:hypothetical protein